MENGKLQEKSKIELGKVSICVRPFGGVGTVSLILFLHRGRYKDWGL